MKKLLSTSFLIIAICFLTNTASFAQHDTKIGAGIVYGSEVESVGLQIGATFRVSPQLGLAPDISFYFPDDEGSDFYIDNFLAINLNGHYILDADSEYHVYALGGLNITSVDFAGDNDFDDSETELGLNLGLGGEYHLDDFSLYSELKYVISDFDRLVLALGFRLPLN